jgi:hypothetical protein
MMMKYVLLLDVFMTRGLLGGGGGGRRRRRRLVVLVLVVFGLFERVKVFLLRGGKDLRQHARIGPVVQS